MISSRVLRVALCQRILPDFRVPIWGRLAAADGLDLVVFHGRGSGGGSTAGSEKEAPFETRLLPTVPLATGEKYRVLHPGLIPRILSGGFDVVISEGLTYFPGSLLLALACRIQGIPFVLYEAPPVHSESVARQYFSPLYRRLATRVLTYNSGGVEYFTGKGYPRDRITCALNTVDTELVLRRLGEFAPLRNDLAVSLGLEGSFVAGYLGALEERKRPEMLLKSVLELAASGLPVKALFVGDGPYQDTLREMVPDELARSVVFVGRRIDDAEKYIQLFSVLVLPSQGGLAVPHGLTCGVPCIATEEAEGSGIRDYIEDGVNGFVLADGDRDLTDILRSLASTPTEMDRLREGALHSRDAFSVVKMVSGIEEAVKTAFEEGT